MATAFYNVDDMYAKDLKAYASKEEMAMLDAIHSSAQIETYEHTMDNFSLDCSFGIFLHKLRSEGYAFVGIGTAPWAHNGRTIAVIFEDSDTFQKYWYHTNDYIIEWWQDQVSEYLGRSKP